MRYPGMAQHLTKALLAGVLAVTTLGASCGGGGGGKNIDDIAAKIDDAARATKPQSGLGVPEQKAEQSAERAICQALEAYSSEGAESLTELISRYAEQQQVLAQYGLNEVDPEAANRLAAAASGIDTSQQAADVASKLGCS